MHFFNIAPAKKHPCLHLRKSQNSKKIIPICLKLSLIFLTEHSTSGKETLMNNISFAMYKPSTDCVIVNTEPNTFIFIRYSLFNRNVILEDPSDILYLYQLAENNPMTYAEFALKEDGLQDYVDAMRWFNY